MKQTQKQIVLNKLKEDGYVSRNWCLSQYISRLGAIMCALKEEGIHYTGANIGGDYVYKLLILPPATLDGQSITYNTPIRVISAVKGIIG